MSHIDSIIYDLQQKETRLLLAEKCDKVLFAINELKKEATTITRSPTIAGYFCILGCVVTVVNGDFIIEIPKGGNNNNLPQQRKDWTN